MATIELKAMVPAVAVPGLAEALAEAGEVSLVLLEDKPSGGAWLIGYFESKAAARAAWMRLGPVLALAGSPVRPDLRRMPDADWKESYKAHFKPWQFGPLHWVPVWERSAYRFPAGDHAIWLDPGMAFGTGNHETTRLCCVRLVEFAAERGLRGTVIDAGCGSGILALSAAALGVAKVAAFDVDPVAVEVSRANAALNQLEDRVDFFVGDLDSGLSRRKADLVLANIQADVLIRHARRLLGAVAPGGRLVLSGILEADLAGVRAAFRKLTRSRMESRSMGEWRDLAITRSAGTRIPGRRAPKPARRRR